MAMLPARVPRRTSFFLWYFNSSKLQMPASVSPTYRMSYFCTPLRPVRSASRNSGNELPFGAVSQCSQNNPFMVVSVLVMNRVRRSQSEQRLRFEETLNVSVIPPFDKRADTPTMPTQGGDYSLICRCFRYARRCASRP